MSAAKGTFKNPLHIAEARSAVPAELAAACDLAARATWDLFGEIDSCILTSHALVAYLRDAGIEAEPVRVSAKAWPKCQQCPGRLLGYEPPGWPRRAASEPGMWKGHLAVACQGNLLDATIEQVNNECIHLAPVVFALYPEWEEGRWLDMINDEGTHIQYSRCWRQIGFKSAPDSRPSHWRDITERMHQLAEADISEAAA